MSTILFDVAEGVATITLHRPEVRNAFGAGMGQELAEAYRQLSDPLKMSEGAVKVAIHRLRQRFRDAVRTEIAQTVATPAEVDEELRCLMTAMSG